MTIQEVIINGLKNEYTWMSDADCNTICDAFLSNVTKDEIAKLNEICELYNDPIHVYGLLINKQNIYSRKQFEIATRGKEIESILISIYGHILETNKFSMRVTVGTGMSPYFSISVFKYNDNLLSIDDSSVNDLYKHFLKEIDKVY